MRYLFYDIFPIFWTSYDRFLISFSLLLDISYNKNVVYYVVTIPFKENLYLEKRDNADKRPYKTI